ncbi:MAG: response regulator with a DNA-binding domain [Acidobacteria bacterium]|nr:response regulator with a DNA-binding domain [Acidobacteriota bacterium]
MKILIADDHTIVRRGLQQIIATRPDWIVAAEIANVDDVLPALRREPFDVAILDVSFAGRSGIDVLVRIRAEFPSLPVLMLSMHAEEQYAIRCLRAGAAGYVQKDRSPEELITAIERVALGRTYVSEAVAEQLASGLARHQDLSPHERLSAREFEVFLQLAAGRSATEIAELLGISIKTVSTYRARIVEKTGLRTTADLVAYAIRNELLDL